MVLGFYKKIISQKNKPDVAVYTNTTNLFFNRKKCKKKNILLVRAYEDFFSIKMAGENKVESLVRRMKKNPFNKKKIHKVYNEVDIIITNSNYMRDKIIKEFEITQPEKNKGCLSTNRYFPFTSI